jgi:hypothetical protein
MERVAQNVNNLLADFLPENYQTNIRNSLQSVLWYCSSNMPEKVNGLEECVDHFNSRMILYNEMVIRPDPCSSDMCEGFRQMNVTLHPHWFILLILLLMRLLRILLDFIVALTNSIIAYHTVFSHFFSLTIFSQISTVTIKLISTRSSIVFCQKKF